MAATARCGRDRRNWEGPEARNDFRERFRSLNTGVRINQPDLYGLVRVLC